MINLNNDGCRFLAIAADRRAGKTELALKRLLDSAYDRAEASVYVYLVPTALHARVLTYPRLKDMVKASYPHDTVEVHKLGGRIIFADSSSEVRIMGADKPVRLDGIRVDGVVIDEVGCYTQRAWETVVRPALSDDGWAILVGTPSKPYESPSWLGDKDEWDFRDFRDSTDHAES